MSRKPYPKYRPSDISWLGNIPAHWEVKPLKAVGDVQLSNVDKLSLEDEIPVRLCNYIDVYRNDYIHAYLDFMQATATRAEIEKFSLQKGDVLLTKDSETWDDIAVSACVKEDLTGILCGYHLAHIRPRKEIDGVYLHRVLQSKEVASQLHVLANGVTRYGISKGDIAGVNIFMPPLEEQRAIIAYLDRETAQIDILIAKKECFITLLNEKRISLISHAITHGINPDAPTRASGVEWLSDIPAHWHVERAKWLFNERQDRIDNPDGELLTVSHITGITPRSHKDVNMFEAETTEGYKICRMGDVVINTMWAWMGAMGASKYEGIVSPSYNVYIPCASLDTNYIDALMRLPQFVAEVTRYSKGIWHSRLRLYPEEFFRIAFPVPPLPEQKAISAFLDTECSKIERLIVKTREHITRLDEYRAALISATVTGKIDVRQTGRSS